MDITLTADQQSTLKSLVEAAQLAIANKQPGANYSAAYAYVAQIVASDSDADADTVTWYQDAALINGATAGSSIAGDLARNFTSEMISQETGRNRVRVDLFAACR